jgi:cytolysin-activating lysine-acyltransferase
VSLEGITRDGAVVASAGATAPASADPAGDFARTLGHVVALLLASPLHRNIFLADLERTVLPPLSLGQFRLFVKGGRPLAFVSWARVSEAVEKRLVVGDFRLAPAEWQSGERLWLMDLVVPPGGEAQIIAHLRERVFPEAEFATIEMPSAGAAPRILRFRGKALAPSASDAHGAAH